MTGSIRALLLDAGGVLMLPTPAVLDSVVGAAGGSTGPDVVRRAHYAAMAASDRLGGDDAVYFRELARGCGVPAEAVDAAGRDLAGVVTPQDWTLVVPGCMEGLRQLAASGLRLAVVSNSGGRIAEVLSAAGVCQTAAGPGVQVSVVSDSHLLGVEKPDPRIFAMTLRELGVAPEQAVHAGDSLAADVRGALAAGVLPLHMDPFGDCPDPAGHRHVHGWDELEDAVIPLVTRTADG